ncbi:ArdC-like ssDNA-binding domain-containing protein [Tenacibaculum sp. 190524A02b]|uniref:ArdC-like ssDNA-binding domain-containing protein n=1 Tax=Tenacibaculum vairaonense TaxID=3137860 RepID=UPI0031FAFFCE
MTNLVTQEETTKKKLTREDFLNKIFEAEGKEAKRQLLKELSNTAKLIKEIEPDAGETVNDIILNRMYKDSTHREFATFKGWKEKGYKVKKGSKSFFIWSKPRKVEKKKKEEEENASTYNMFGIAYLFSNTQVEEIEK